MAKKKPTAKYKKINKLNKKIDSLEIDVADLLNNPHCDFRRCPECDRYNSTMMVCRHCGRDGDEDDDDQA